MSSPRVWAKFTSKKPDGTVFNFSIQDLPKERLGEVIEFDLEHFFKDEPIQRVMANVGNHSQEGMDECREIKRGLYNDPLVKIVACFLENDSKSPPEIIGLSVIKLTSVEHSARDDFEDVASKVSSDEVKKVFKVLAELFAIEEKVIETYGIKEYYDGRGVMVHSDYRGLGLATEFLKIRKTMCREHGIPLTVAWMTALGSQKAAARDGWQTVREVNYDDLGRRHDIVFENAPPSAKLMLYVDKQ